jgi:hypothetical protein
VLSGCTDGAVINGAYDLGAAFLLKPFTEFRIRRFLRSAAGSVAAPVSLPVLAPELPRAAPAAVPETFLACVEHLRALFAGRQDVPTRYAIGTTVAAIKSRTHLFGLGAVLALARAVDEDLPTLYRHAAVADQWTPAEMDALVLRRGRDGRTLSWSHIAVLGAVADRAVRARLVTRALDDGLAVRELTEIVAVALAVTTRPASWPRPRDS